MNVGVIISAIILCWVLWNYSHSIFILGDGSLNLGLISLFALVIAIVLFGDRGGNSHGM